MDDPNWRDRIVIDPDIHHGAPVIRGTRVSVAVIVGSVAAASIDEVLRAYPHITREDVAAALFFAANKVSRVRAKRKVKRVA